MWGKVYVHRLFENLDSLRFLSFLCDYNFLTLNLPCNPFMCMLKISKY